MSKTSQGTRAFRRQAEKTARQARSIQRKIDRKTSRKRKSETKHRAMQAGTKHIPSPNFLGSTCRSLVARLISSFLRCMKLLVIAVPINSAIWSHS